MMLEIDNVGMYDTAVENQVKVFVSTELSGGGTATARSSVIAKKASVICCYTLEYFKAK